MSEPLESLVAVVTTDLAAITRGRLVAASRYEKIAAAGVGWLQANICLTPFNGIADPNPWGSQGDLRLVPDPGARFRTEQTGAATAFDMVIGDIVELDGDPWRACPRTFLRDALADLKAATGLELIAAFEQEFALSTPFAAPAHSLSLEGVRRIDPFGPRLMAALGEAGVEPEVFIAEFGPNQFEITCAPAPGLTAADRAVAVREIVRETGRASGMRASFTPKAAPDAVGSGVHIHVSLRDASGSPAMHDPAGAGGLSDIGAAFCAGVLAHMPAITIFAAPSPISYLRLKPHTWSAAWTSLAQQDREAALRICPTTSLGGGDRARQFNVEFRAADATGNPYLALAALVRAGLEGIGGRLPRPPLVTVDPETLDVERRNQLGLRRLPDSLQAAMAALEADPTVRGWFSDDFLQSFLGVRRAELAQVKGLDAAGICGLYGALY